MGVGRTASLELTLSSVMLDFQEVRVRNTFIEVDEDGTPLVHPPDLRRSKSQPESLSNLTTEDEATDAEQDGGIESPREGVPEPADGGPWGQRRHAPAPQFRGGGPTVLVRNTFIEVDLRPRSHTTLSRSKTVPICSCDFLPCRCGGSSTEDEDESGEDDEDDEDEDGDSEVEEDRNGLPLGATSPTSSSSSRSSSPPRSPRPPPQRTPPEQRPRPAPGAEEDAGPAAALLAELKAFDAIVAGRTPRSVLDEDMELVATLGKMVKEAFQGGKLPWEPHKVTRQEGVLDRVTLFSGGGLEASLHLFRNATETFKHNHRANFLSYCLSGDYKHKQWGVDTSKDGAYFEFNRTEDPGLEHPTRKDGVLEVQLVTQHMTGLTYFISANSVHTVSHGNPAPVMTFVVKGLEKTGFTFVWNESEKYAGPAPNQQQVEPTEEEREEVLAAVLTCCRGM